MWGQWNSTLTATASPSVGGGVCASKKDVSSLSDSDYSSTSTSGKTYCATIWSTATFYAYYKVNPGYKFVNWSTGATSWKISVTADRNDKNPSVTANFAPIDYSIRFNGNGATSGTMSNLAMKYATAKSLTANAFARQYTVTYTPNGGSCATASATANYTFAGWNSNAAGTGTAYSAGQSVNNLTTTDGAVIDLYAQWNSAAITLPTATKPGCVLDGWYSGDTKIGEAGDSYTPAANITLTAKWIDKYTPSITGSNQTLSVDDEQAGAFTFSHTDAPEAHITVLSINAINNGDGQVIEYDAVNNKIIAHNAGVATIYFTQDETSAIKSGTSATYTYTVNKIGNTLAATLAYTKYVDEAITNVIANKNSNVTVTTSSSDATIAYYNISENKIYIPNSSDKSFSTRDITINIAQAENYKYTGVEKNIVVTVNKYTPVFTWNSGNVTYYYNTKSYDIFSTTSPCDYTFTSSNSASAVAVKGTKDTLIIYNVEEPATITVSQEENYKWNGKAQDYVINPVEQTNHIEATLTSSNYTAFAYGAPSNATWSDNGCKLGDGGLDKTACEYIIHFTGVPEYLSFNKHMDNYLGQLPVGSQSIVYQSADGSNWSQVWINEERKADVTAANILLSPTARYLKFYYNGSIYCYYRNIHITELNQFSATPASVNFGAKGINFGTQDETVVFNHANAGRITTMEIVGDDAAYFSIERSTIPGTGRDLYATASIVVSFDNKKGPAGHEPAYSAVLRIEDNATHFLNIPLSGVRDGKTDPEFSFNANHLPYFVGTNIANVASSSNTDYANCPLTFETTDASIAEVIDGTLHIYNKKEEVTITIRQGENKDFSAGSATFTFTPRERPERAVPLQLVKSIYNEGTVEAGSRCTWLDDDGGCIRVGNNSTIIDDWIWYDSEKNFTIAFDGQPGRLSFEYKNTGWLVTSDPSGNHTYEVQESSDGSSWNTIWYNDATTNEWTAVKEVTINPSTRYLRFSFSGNYWCFFRNINISELVGYKYLRAESDGRYLSRGAKWGTQAIVDDFGVACRISNYTNDNTNFYTRFLFADNQQYLYEADNHEIFTDDGTAANTYNLWKENVIDGTIITFQSGNEYPGDSRKGQYITLEDDALALTADAAAATRWQMEDYTEHEAYITAMMDREAAEAAAKDFGSSVNTLAKVRTEIAENDFEMTPIDIPTLALGEQKGEYRSGVAGTNAIYDNTISDLVPGFYRLTVKAFYRISSADIAWACHAAGMESVLACVYANDVEYPIQSLYNSYHVSPLETSDELRGGHYYSTDLTSAGETFEDAKRYLNDVYVYVSADAGKTTGTLRYGIKNPSYVPGAWLAYENITLTRIARKEFIFEGTEADPTDWETNNNWNRNTEPDEHHVVIIRHDIEIDEEVSVFELRIEDDAKVIVLPSGGLTIGAGGVKGATKSNLILKADADAKSATKGKTGYLRISPAYTGTMPEATIELFTIGYYNMGVSNHNAMASWQYVGSPVVESVAATSVFRASFIYNWDEASDSWQNNRSKLSLQPFTGYATSQFFMKDGWLITNAGQLVSNQGVQEVNLGYSGEEKGHNVVANSFVAPIDITKFTDDDFVNAENVIYIFNTGSRADIEALESTKGGELDAKGQFIPIPVGSAKELKGAFSLPTAIAPMQGFCVNANAEGAKIKFDYSKLVWEGTSSNVPLRVKNNTEKSATGALCVSLYADGWNDKLYLLESEDYSANYENGYDANKRMSGSLNVFAIEDENHLAVDATNSIIGTRVGVRTGEETAYTFSFNNFRSENELALLDNETEQTIDIEEGVEYTFFAEPNTVIADRFMIVERDNADKPGVTTSIEQTAEVSKVHKFIQNGQLFILKNGVLYDAMGNVVR